MEQASGKWAEGVATDGNLVTAQAWPDHPDWLAASMAISWLTFHQRLQVAQRKLLAQVFEMETASHTTWFRRSS